MTSRNADSCNRRVNLLACGLSPAEVLEELPDLEKEDIEAVLRSRASN